MLETVSSKLSLPHRSIDLIYVTVAIPPQSTLEPTSKPEYRPLGLGTGLAEWGAGENMNLQNVHSTYEFELFVRPSAERENFTVSESEREGLRTITLGLLHCDLRDSSPFLEAAASLGPVFTPRLQKGLASLKNGMLNSILVENLPTFHHEENAELKTRVLSMLISCMVGNPFQYQQQNHGEIVARVSPEMGREDTHSSSGRKKFGWHSDDSFLDERFRTDFIQLSGFYNPAQVQTNLSSISEILEFLDEETVCELMKPQFSIGMPASFRVAEGDVKTRVPVLWFDGNRKMNMAVSEYNVKSMTVAGEWALKRLFQAAEICAENYNLQPGNLLIFNNNRFLHARGEIIGERTVFRIYIKESLKHLAPYSQSKNVFDLTQIIGQMSIVTN